MKISFLLQQKPNWYEYVRHTILIHSCRIYDELFQLGISLTLIQKYKPMEKTN